MWYASIAEGLCRLPSALPAIIVRAASTLALFKGVIVWYAV